MSIKETLLKWLVPSKWVTWLNGKKRILGAIQLVLWVLVFAIPRVKPEWAFLAATGLKVQEFLQGLGLDVGSALLSSGTGFTVVGLLDWIMGHKPSKLTAKLLEKAEKPLK